MHNNHEFKPDERAILESIHHEIDYIVDNKVISMVKMGQHHVDRESLVKYCEQQFFDLMQKELARGGELYPLFYDQLKQDNPALWEHIDQTLGRIQSQLPHCKTLEDAKTLQLFAREDIDELYQIGMRWFDAERYDRALLYLAFLALIHAEDPNVWFIKGMCEHNLGIFRAALHSYSHVITLAPDYIPVHVQIINCLLLGQYLNEARHYYETFIQEVDPQAFSDNKPLRDQLALIEEFLSHPVYD